MFKRLVLFAVILAAVIVFNASASTPRPPEVPRDYVVDLAGIFTKDTLYQLNASLRDLERKTTAQVLVLTVQSLAVKALKSSLSIRKKNGNSVKRAGTTEFLSSLL